jgi:hypothetical protein
VDVGVDADPRGVAVRVLEKEVRDLRADPGQREETPKLPRDIPAVTIYNLVTSQNPASYRMYSTW